MCFVTFDIDLGEHGKGTPKFIELCHAGVGRGDRFKIADIGMKSIERLQVAVDHRTHPKTAHSVAFSVRKAVDEPSGIIHVDTFFKMIYLFSMFNTVTRDDLVKLIVIVLLAEH